MGKSLSRQTQGGGFVCNEFDSVDEIQQDLKKQSLFSRIPATDISGNVTTSVICAQQWQLREDLPDHQWTHRASLYDHLD